ncbi:MAG: MlaD family protein [Pseudomonadota bacterium]
MNDDLPEVMVSPSRKLLFSGASFVWLLPILALVVALGVAWQTYYDRGPLITVEFEKGAGINARETELRFRDVTVGIVESVGFSEGLERVIATIRVDKDVAPFIDQSAVFWIVQPEVTAQGITGLSTVLSGVYIEGSWDDQIGAAANSFQGASEEPLIRPGQQGLEIAFRTVGDSQLTDNAPILYKGIEVGRVGRAEIAPRGNFAIVEALIFEEHRSLVNDSTRFWDASGFRVTIGPAGAQIDFSSIATLVGGGITFDTFVSGGDRVVDGTIFEIFPDQESARNSIFNASEVAPLKVAVVFEDNISGLAIGSPVELSGFKIGEVEALSGIIDFGQFGDRRVRLNAILSIQPARLGLPGAATAENALSFIRERVAIGMRARLANASLLTGGLKVELVMLEEETAGVTLNETDGRPPLIPTTRSNVSDTAATVEGVFTRVNNLPIEELLESAITFLNAAETFVADDDLREAPQDLRALLGDLQGLVGSQEVQDIPIALNATLARIETLVTRLEQERLVDRLISAVDGAADAATAVEASVVGLPELIAQINAIAANAAELELAQLLEELTKLTRSAETLISSNDAQALPASLKQALDELNATLMALRSGGAVDNITQTLTAARTAADSIAVSVEDLPQILERLTALFEQASETISGYNQGDVLGRETRATLRDIQKAADALASLARTIERNPNSLLLGR